MEIEGIEIDNNLLEVLLEKALLMLDQLVVSNIPQYEQSLEAKVQLILSNETANSIAITYVTVTAKCNKTGDTRVTYKEPLKDALLSVIEAIRKDPMALVILTPLEAMGLDVAKLITDKLAYLTNFITSFETEAHPHVYIQIRSVMTSSMTSPKLLLCILRDVDGTYQYCQINNDNASFWIDKLGEKVRQQLKKTASEELASKEENLND